MSVRDLLTCGWQVFRKKAAIAKQRYSMRRLERSKRLVEDSRQRIFETELSFREDD
jgi:hypothetical protein